MLDLVVLGASGFTGRHVVKYMAEKMPENIRWGIAGRSESKLRDVLTWSDCSRSIPILLADINDPASLRQVCEQTRVIINCVGPFRLYGEPVVKACIDWGTNYVDVCGEPEFIETMMYKYDALAKERGVTIVSACGFDSVPTDIGVKHLQTYCQQKNLGLDAVEMFFELQSGPAGGAGHYGTWESAVLSAASCRKFRKVRQAMQKPKIRFTGTSLPFYPYPHREQRMGAYTIPFLFADPSIVRESQRYSERPVRFAGYVLIRSWFYTWLIWLGILAFFLLAQIPFTRKLMLKYPRLFSLGTFSHRGPTMQQLEQARFTTTLIGRVANQQRVVLVVSGPEIGYVTTPICVAQCALASLKTTVKGVVTPAVAFGDALVEPLHQNGIHFNIIS